MLENRDAKLHDCIRSAAQQHNDAASQQMAANLKSVKGTRKDIPVGDSGLENAIHLKLKKPREGHSAMRRHNFLKMEYFVTNFFFKNLKTICLKVICVLTFMFY
jgi:hypothetical protein